MQPEQYDLLYDCEERMWWFVGMRRIAATLLGRRGRPGLRCLEAGCGTGFNSGFFAREYGWQVFPFDLSEHALRYCRRRGLERLACASLADLPYRDASFDCVTCLDVIVSLSEPERPRALRELCRVLKPGGFLLMRVAALPWLRGGHARVASELHRYRLGELTSAVQAAGFHVEHCTYANSLLLPLAALKRRVLEPLGLASPEGDVRPVAPWMDRLFLTALRLEDRILCAGLRLPIGVSAILVAQRPAPAALTASSARPGA
jgi:ubiquinone/menaquinone biosynthesis C-methylase UbiE